MKRPWIICACAALAALLVSETGNAQSPAQRGNGAPYEVIGSEVWSVPDPVSGRDYQVFVALPASYESEPDRRYRVLYVTDADYAFPVINQIRRRLNVERPKVEEFILVGLSYAVGEGGLESRRRDYTPTPNGPGGASRDAVHGGGAAYIDYLRDEVKPFIESRFRTDPENAVFLGHSYGALLGAQILFTDPGLFGGYVLGSPSFWFDGRHIFDLELAYAAAHDDLRADVYMYIGEYETLRPGDPRYNRTVDMVADNRAFESVLTGRRYPGLSLLAEELDGEDHMTVAPRGFTRALLHLLPAR